MQITRRLIKGGSKIARSVDFGPVSLSLGFCAWLSPSTLLDCNIRGYWLNSISVCHLAAYKIHLKLRSLLLDAANVMNPVWILRNFRFKKKLQIFFSLERKSDCQYKIQLSKCAVVWLSWGIKSAKSWLSKPIHWYIIFIKKNHTYQIVIKMEIRYKFPYDLYLADSWHSRRIQRGKPAFSFFHLFK